MAAGVFQLLHHPIAPRGTVALGDLAARAVCRTADRARHRRSDGSRERRLQQLFHTHIGLSPTAWRRLARLHACLRELRRRPGAAWAVLTFDADFYDQSHLVNEFR